jgi:hypothetical protein
MTPEMIFPLCRFHMRNHSPGPEALRTGCASRRRRGPLCGTARPPMAAVARPTVTLTENNTPGRGLCSTDADLETMRP